MEQYFRYLAGWHSHKSSKANPDNLEFVKHASRSTHGPHVGSNFFFSVDSFEPELRSLLGVQSFHKSSFKEYALNHIGILLMV